MQFSIHSALCGNNLVHTVTHHLVIKDFKQIRRGWVYERSIHPIAWLLLLFASALLGAAQAAEPCQIAELAARQVTAVLGKDFPASVACSVATQGEVEGYLRRVIATQIPEEKLRYEEFVYKQLGFIPAGLDYQDSLVKLYLAQLGGYYDPERKVFIMADWLPALSQMDIAVHELTHALQDQEHSLSSFIDERMDNSDALMARSAIAEGHASAVALDYQRRLRKLAPLSRVEKRLSDAPVSLAASGLPGVPLSLKIMASFPYSSGLAFVHYILRRGGYPKAWRLFQRPPRSTEEILHPDKYFREKPSFEVIHDVPQCGGDREAHSVYQDTLGELAIAALLSHQPFDAGAYAAAAGWDGDRVEVFEGVRERCLSWVIRWDTAGDAIRFLRRFLAQRPRGVSYELQDKQVVIKAGGNPLPEK